MIISSFQTVLISNIVLILICCPKQGDCIAVIDIKTPLPILHIICNTFYCFLISYLCSAHLQPSNYEIGQQNHRKLKLQYIAHVLVYVYNLNVEPSKGQAKKSEEEGQTRK